MSIIMVGILFFISGLSAQVISISEALSVQEGAVVEVEGVILNPPNERSLRFIQDETGGMAIYVPDNSFNQNVREGDHIRIRGRKVIFQGLHEIGDVFDYQLLGSGDLPDPQLGITDSGESSEYTKLPCVFWDTGESELWSSGEFMRFLDGAAINYWIPETASFLRDDIDNPLFSFTGIPYKDDGGTGFLILKVESALDSGCLVWQAPPVISNAGTNFVISDIFLSSAFDGYVVAHSSVQAPDTVQISGTGRESIMIEGLRSAELYELEYIVYNEEDTLFHDNHWVATQSTSPKNIEVFFNNPIRDSIAIRWNYYVQGADLVNEISDRIDAAVDEVNLCAYNFNNLTIRAALDRAHNRGIRVRCIVDGNNRNFGFSNTEFPVFRMRSNALMHHKFIVIDPDSDQNSWLFMGGTNLTRNQLYVDPNSALTFEDQMLARVYLKEFETLWGGTQANYRPETSRRSTQKLNNTPAKMFLNSIPVRSYFSPSDGTTQGIVRALESAEREIYFSLLTFTKNEVRDLLLKKHEEGVKIRGIINNINDNGGEYFTLRENGIDVQASDQGHIHHHKYAIIDPGTENAALIIGSHNWTQKAEDTNDENLLVLFDGDLSLIFLEEFMARWCENDPLHSECILSEDPEMGSFSGLQVIPQPAFSDDVNLYWGGEQAEEFELFVASTDGRLIQLPKQMLNPGVNALSGLPSLSSGMYYLHYQSTSASGQLKLLLLGS
ncbi:MAG: hypothetical protein GVY20_06020 [Bacteroidetes bacterium]|nr:hypothetical protein [Bacteroidota bacterium]